MVQSSQFLETKPFRSSTGTAHVNMKHEACLLIKTESSGPGSDQGALEPGHLSSNPSSAIFRLQRVLRQVTQVLQVSVSSSINDDDTSQACYEL